MKNKKVLIIGGNGFIGCNLCQKYINEGWGVYSFDRIEPLVKHAEVSYIIGDFFDDSVLEKSVEGMDLIIHSLSTINPGNSNEKYMQGYEKDFIQSVKLFSWAVQKGIKLIFLSSGGTVYGVQEQQPIKEEQLPVPINHYGAVKLSIENVLRTFNAQSHKNMIIVRVSNPYGPGQDYTKGVGFIDAALKKAVAKEEIEIWGDGEVIRDYIYIDDVCKMIYALSEYTGSQEVFNISTNEAVSLNDIVGIIRSLGMDVKVNYKPGRNVDVKKILLDNTKIKKVYLGEIIKIDIGLKKYYEYIIAQTDQVQSEV